MNLENKFNKLANSAAAVPSDWQKKATQRIANSKSITRARQIALRVLQALRDQGISQIDLAEKLGVSKQHVSKIKLTIYMWYGFFLGLVERVRLLKQGTTAVATVIELLEEKDSDGDSQYRPVFRFTTHSKEQITFKQSYNSRPPTFNVGEDVNIVYNEIDPQQTVVLSYFSSFGWVVALAAIAMPMIVIGGGFFWARSFFRMLVG